MVTPRGKKEADKAKKRLRTIAGRIIRDLERKLAESKMEKYIDDLAIFKRVVNQREKDKNKIYSLHEPKVSCIAKGKTHKPYEFGSKVSFAMLPGSKIIVG